MLGGRPHTGNRDARFYPLGHVPGQGSGYSGFWLGVQDSPRPVNVSRRSGARPRLEFRLPRTLCSLMLGSRAKASGYIVWVLGFTGEARATPVPTPSCAACRAVSTNMQVLQALRAQLPSCCTIAGCTAAGVIGVLFRRAWNPGTAGGL